MWGFSALAGKNTNHSQPVWAAEVVCLPFQHLFSWPQVASPQHSTEESRATLRRSLDSFCTAHASPVFCSVNFSLPSFPKLLTLSLQLRMSSVQIPLPGLCPWNPPGTMPGQSESLSDVLLSRMAVLCCLLSNIYLKMIISCISFSFSISWGGKVNLISFTPFWSKVEFFHLHFWISSLEVKSWVDGFVVLFQHLKDVVPLSPASIAPEEKSAHLNDYYCVCNVSFFFAAFKITFSKERDCTCSVENVLEWKVRNQEETN